MRVASQPRPQSQVYERCCQGVPTRETKVTFVGDFTQVFLHAEVSRHVKGSRHGRCPLSWKNGNSRGVALSCHTALDLLYQEMHEAWWLGCRCQRGPLSQQGKPFSHRGRAVTKKERDVVRKKEKESEQQAEISKEDLRVSSLKALFASF